MLKTELKKTEKIIFITSICLYLILVFSFLFQENELIKKTTLNTIEAIIFLFAGILSYRVNHSTNLYLRKPFWLLISLSSFFYFVGQVLFAYYEFVGKDAFPTIADLFFTIFYVLFFVAFFFVAKSEISTNKQRQIIIEYLVLSIGIIVISYNFLSLSITNYLLEKSFDWALAITITYTTLDVLIILIILYHLIRLKAEDPNYLILFIFLIGAICLTIGDFYLQLGIPFRIVFVGGQISDIFWSITALTTIAATILNNSLGKLQDYLKDHPKLISLNKSITFSLFSFLIIIQLFQLIWSLYHPLAFNLVTLGLTIIIFSIFASYRQINLYVELDQMNSNLTNAYNQLSVANYELETLNEDLRLETQALEESQFELLNQIETKNKIFSIISHDIRSPLGGIMAGLDTMERYFDNFNKEELLKFMQINSNAARNLFQFVESLLEWSRIQRGAFRLFPKYYNFQDLANSTLSLVETKAKEKNIELELKVDIENKVFVDGEGIKTILRNLLTNAIKFSPENSKITIKAEDYDDCFVKVSITNNGIGMSQEDVDKLFDIRTNPKLIGNSPEKGTGLGLLICKELVELHKGKIWVESKLNEGTTFSFIVPKNEFDCNKDVINV